MQSRVPFLIAFATTFLFCSSPQAPPVVIAPLASATPLLSVPNAHAAPASGADPALAKERAEAAKKVITYETAAYASGLSTITELTEWSERSYRAQQDVLAGHALVTAAMDRFAAMKNLEALATRRVQAGTAGSADIAKATYFRADAEIELARVMAQ